MNDENIAIRSTAGTTEPIHLPQDIALTNRGIVDLEERARERYQDHVKPGGKFAFHCDRVHGAVKDFKLGMLMRK